MKKSLTRFITLICYLYALPAQAQAPGNALEFAGTSTAQNSIFVPNGGSSPLDISSSITIETWIKPSRKTISDEANRWNTIMMKGSYGYGLVIGDNNCQASSVGKLGYWGQNGCGSVPFSTTAIEYGKWNHVAVVISSGNLTFYINGEASGTAAGVSIPNGGPGSSLYIGAQDRTSGGNGWYKGTMDEVRIWNVARTANQIKTNMYNVVDPSSAGLVAYFRFDQGTAGGSNTGITAADDLTSNNLDGTLDQFTLSGTASNFVESYSMVVPKAATASSISSTGFTANWSAPEVGTTEKYLLDVAADKNFTSMITGFSGKDVGTSVNYPVTGLPGYNAYYYRLRSEKTSVTGTGAKSATILAAVPVAGLGNAINFERSRSEGIQVPHSAAFNFGTGSYTIESWVKRSSGSGFFTIVGKQTNLADGMFLRFNDNVISFAAGRYPASTDISSTSSISDGNWHHIAAVRNSSDKTMKIYIDGVINKSQTFSTLYTANTSAALGIGFKPNYGEYFNGGMDEVRIWNTARTASQIKDYMNTPLAGTESGLVAYFYFEDAGNTSLRDAGPNNFTGTYQNPDGDEAITGNTVNNVTVAFNSLMSIRAGASDVNTAAVLTVSVTSLPSHGKIYQTNDGVTKLGEITAAPATISDTGGNPRRVIYEPASSYSGSDSFTYRASDGANTSEARTVSITVEANTAPALSGGPYNFSTINEDSTSAGMTVSSILAGLSYSDPNTNALSGIAVTTVTSNSNWQYSTDGVTWTNFGTISGTAALLLGSNTQVRYFPDRANGETATFTFRAWDQTSGTPSTNSVRQTADVSSNGGSTAFSSTTANSTIIVTSVNDSPVITSDGGTSTANANVSENSTTVTTVVATDVDTGTTITYSISGGADQSKFSINSSSGILSFISPPDFELPSDTDANNKYLVTVRAGDGTANTEQTITVTVTDIDDTAPSVPTGLTGISGNTQITLNWNANIEGDLNGYRIYGGTSVNPGTLLQTVTAPAATYTVSGLTNGTTYYYRISAVDNTGNESNLTSDVTSIPKANQNITFNALTAKTYGDNSFILPATATSGLAVNYLSSDPTVASVSGNTVTIIKAGSTVISAAQAGNSSFNAAVDVPQTLVVNKKAMTITADAKNKNYGDSDPALTYTFNPVLIIGDSFSGSLSRVSGENTGTYAINQGTLTLSSNYTISFQTADLNITARPITATAAVKTKTYGDTDPALTYTFSPVLITGDSFSGSLSRVSGENAGTHAINQGTLALNSNYILNFQPSVLNITARSITVTANNAGKVTGATLSGHTGSTAFSAAGLANSETIGSVTITYGPGASDNAVPATYTGSVIPANATGGTFHPGNYVITYVPGDLIVTARPTSIAVASSLTAFITCAGNTSLSQSFNVSGSDLAGNISVNAPSGFEVSLSAEAGYGNSVLINPSAGTVISTAVYIRIKNTASGTLSGDLSITSTGVSAKTISITGIVRFADVPLISSGGPLSFCSGGSVVLTSSAATGNQWYKDGIIIAGASTQAFTATSSGAYTVTVTNSDACSATSAATVINVIPLPAASITNGFVVSLGSGGSATLTANAATAYQWYKDGTILNGQTSGILDVTSPGSYTLQVTNNSGCISPRSAPTVVVSLPSPAASGATSFCEGGSVDLTVALLPGQTFIRWKDGNNNTVSTSLTYKATSSGSFSAEVDAGVGVESTRAIHVTVNPLPLATINAAFTAACAGESVLLTASGGTGYQWYLDNNAINGATGTTYQASASGSYTVNAFNASGCFSVSPATAVSIKPLPAIIPAPVVHVATTDVSFSIPFYSATGADQYSLTGINAMSGFVNVINAPLSKSPIRVSIPGSAAGSYTFSLRVRNSLTGCSSTAPVTVRLNVILASQNIDMGSFAAKVYGDSDFDPGAGASSGLTVAYASSNPAVASIVSGRIRILGAGSTTITATQAGNSVYSAAEPVNELLTINPKAVIVTADSKAKVYGDKDPLFTYAFTPALLTGDSFTGSLARATGENAGTYTISQGTLTLNGNYILDFNPGSLLINRKDLIVTADDKVKVRGTENPELTVHYSGFFNGENAGVLGALPVASTTATSSSPTGSYPIIVSGGYAVNYSFRYIAGTLNIGPGRPKDISLATETLYENQGPGLKAGTFSSSSDEADATFTYSFVTGTGDDDNHLFTITGNELRTASSFNYEQRSVYNIRVRSAVQYGLSLDKLFAISIKDVNEAPTLGPLADAGICYTTSMQTVELRGITPGPEAGQTVSAGVVSNNPGLFEQLNVTDNKRLNYRLKAGQSGIAIITVTVTDNGGTANGGIDTVSRSFSLTVNPLPMVHIITDKGTAELSKGETLILTASGGTAYSWRNSPGILSGRNTAALTIRPESSATYRVQATTTAGCVTEAEIAITVHEDYQAVTATNLISPNGDGINDNFIIRNIDMYPNNVVKIYDRAGRLLYGKENYTNEWNGTFQGSPLEEDTYYYIVDFGPGKPRLRGFITIVGD